jgi:hypothetical protein
MQRMHRRYLYIYNNYLSGTLPESLSGLSASLQYVTRRRRCDALPCRC